MSDKKTIKKTKKTKAIDRVWEDINTADNVSNADEIYFMKLLARNIAQNEDLCHRIQKKYGIGMAISMIFGILGAVVMVITIIMSGSETVISLPFLTTKPTTLDTGLIALFVFAAILLEVLAGIGMCLYWHSLQQLRQYRDALYDNEQFLLMVGMAAKAKGLSKNADKELYARIVESELKRREQLAFQQKETK